MPKREKPAILIHKIKSGLSPVSAFDEEQLAALPLNTVFELKTITKRSWPQLKLYWSILSGVVKATDIAPSSAHLHDLIKVDLGYVTLVPLLDGSIACWPDSAALDKMTEPEFNAFMDAAVKLLAEKCGFDPTQVLEAAA